MKTLPVDFTENDQSTPPPPPSPEVLVFYKLNNHRGVSDLKSKVSFLMVFSIFPDLCMMSRTLVDVILRTSSTTTMLSLLSVTTETTCS